MLKASGWLEVKEWELGDLKDTKSGSSFYLLLASRMGFFSSENDLLALGDEILDNPGSSSMLAPTQKGHPYINDLD